MIPIYLFVFLFKLCTNVNFDISKDMPVFWYEAAITKHDWVLHWLKCGTSGMIISSRYVYKNLWLI